jgi:DNA-binding beta-propeller fold protein YncE
MIPLTLAAAIIRLLALASVQIVLVGPRAVSHSASKEVAMSIRPVVHTFIALAAALAGFTIIMPFMAALPIGASDEPTKPHQPFVTAALPQVIATLPLTRGIGVRPVAVDANPATGYVYIVNYESDSVSILSGTQFVKNVPVGEDPRSIGVNPATGLVYVPNFNGGTLSILSGTQVVKIIPGITGDSVGVHSDTGYVYVGDRGRIDVLTGTQFITRVEGLPTSLGDSPMQFAADPVSDYMYALDAGGLTVLTGTEVITTHVLNHEEGMLDVDSVTGYAYAATIDSVYRISGTEMVNVISLTPALAHVYAAVYDTDNDHLYVGGDPDIRVLSGTQTIGVISTSLPTRQIVVDPGSDYVYAIGTDGRIVTVISDTTVVTTMTLNTTSDWLWPGQTMAAINPATDYLYVLNGAASTVSILRDLQELATLRAGVSFKRIQSNPATGYVYAAMQGTDGVIVLSDIRTVTTLPTDRPPQDIGVNPATGYVYVPTPPDLASHSIGQILSGTQVITALASTAGPDYPTAVGVNPKTGYVYIVGEEFFNQPVVRAFSGTQSITDVYYCGPTTCGTPWAVAVNPSNGFVYVADSLPILHVFSQTQFIADVFGGSGPAIQVNPATGYVYADLCCGWLGIVSGTQYITDFVVGSEVGAIGVNPASGYVYVTDEISDTVKILSGTQVIDTQTTGHDPRAIAVDAERGYVYIANAASDEVTLLSGTEVLTTIPVGAGPTVIDVNPATGLVYVGNEGDQTISIIGLPRHRTFLPIVRNK